MSGRSGWTLALLAIGVALALSARDAGAQRAAQGDGSSGCTTCHGNLKPALIEGIHGERGITCTNCHGGDPESLELPDAHRAPFRTLTVGVDRRVLIPRPETEGLVEHALRWAQARWPDHAWGDALDVGTGSGCIALSLAAEGRFRRVVGVDRSAAALAVARANRSLVSSPTPVDFEAADLFPAGDELFDVIVANPPYLTEVEHTALDPGVRDFEPLQPPTARNRKPQGGTMPPWGFDSPWAFRVAGYSRGDARSLPAERLTGSTAPVATAAMKSSTERLKRSGASRFTAWPQRG